MCQTKNDNFGMQMCQKERERNANKWSVVILVIVPYANDQFFVYLLSIYFCCLFLLLHLVLDRTWMRWEIEFKNIQMRNKIERKRQRPKNSVDTLFHSLA